MPGPGENSLEPCVFVLLLKCHLGAEVDRGFEYEPGPGFEFLLGFSRFSVPITHLGSFLKTVRGEYLPGP